MKIIQLFILLIISNSIFSNQTTLDSLIIQYDNINELDDSLQKSLLYNLSYSILNSNPDSSLLFAEKLIELSSTNDDFYFLYRGYLQKGNAHRLKGELDLALESYLQSSNYANKINYARGIAIVFSNMGDTYSIAKDHNNAISYYKKAIKELSTQEDTITLASILLNTGSEYLYQPLTGTDSALVYFQKSLELFRKVNHPIGIAYNLGNIGRIQSTKRNFSDAEANLKEAISVLNKYGDKYAVISYKIRLGKIYQDQNANQKALIETTEAYKLADASNLLPQKRDAAERLSLIYSELNDHKNAYHYQSQYIAYRDSINNEETIRKMADLRTEYEVAQKQAEVEVAQAQLELETKRRQTQQIVGLALIIVLVLSGILSYVLFRHAKRERYVNKLLREQKEELMAQRDLLEDVNNTKDRFFSIISHDLRGPIGVLNGTTMLIREFLESKDYGQLDDLTTNMEYSVKKVQTLLDNLLEWAISQRGQYNYIPERVELNQLLLETISIFSDMAQAKRIVLSFEQKYAEVYATVDRNSLTTIMRNLISNALKFTQKCGAVDIKVEKGKKDIQIIVKDTGVGISQDKISSLFDIEAKKSTWGTAKEKGLGIGLNLVYEFVKMNNGVIQVRSTEGVGSTFIITLPAERQMAGTEKAQYI